MVNSNVIYFDKDISTVILYKDESTFLKPYF